MNITESRESSGKSFLLGAKGDMWKDQLVPTLATVQSRLKGELDRKRHMS
jgi:hypothetical protein